MTSQNDWVALSQVHKRLAEILESRPTAEILLLEALRDEKIAMEADYYMNGNSYPERILRSGNFRDARFVIWAESRVEHQVERSTFGSKGETHYHMGDFHRVKLQISDITHLWPEYSAQIAAGPGAVVPPVTTPPRKGVGGAKGEYDWEKYLIEAAVFMYVSGPPKSQEALFEYLWDLFGGREGGPSPPSMKAHIGPLYRRFKATDDS